MNYAILINYKSKKRLKNLKWFFITTYTSKTKQI